MRRSKCCVILYLEILTAKVSVFTNSDMSNKKNTTISNSEIDLEDISNAPSLEQLNEFLTKAMANKEIHVLIKEDDLGVVVNAIVNLAQNKDGKQVLLASAMLGRLAKVARNRGGDVLKRVPDLIKEEPLSLDVFSDKHLTNINQEWNIGKIKHYVSQSLSFIDAEWLQDYCVREAIKVDASENARGELLRIALERYGNSAQWINAIAAHASVLPPAKSPNAGLKRVRRMFSAILDQLQQWQGELGNGSGKALDKLFARFVEKTSDNVEEVALFDVINCSIEMLLRFIELRFSIALHADTYAVIRKSKQTLGDGKWIKFLQKSDKVSRLRICLLEAILVLARQKQTDHKIMAVISSVYASQPHACRAIENHFESAFDLDPECRNWWCSAGEPSVSKREVEHKLTNTEDEQIGSLLIEVENSKGSMQKLEQSVAPVLEISDPVLSDDLKKMTRSYSQIIQIVHRLARMRILDKTDSVGKISQYSRSEHEMLGGHQPGVRNVKVVRDGITKEFGGRKKTLVKAWVEPSD